MASQHISSRVIYVRPAGESDDDAPNTNDSSTGEIIVRQHNVVLEYDLDELIENANAVRVTQDESDSAKSRLGHQISTTSSDNADSGISLADDKRADVVTSHEDIPDVVDEEKTSKSRISIGVMRRADDDVRRITSRSRSRRSCSLPDILDIDRYECCPNSPRDMRISEAETENGIFSSSNSLSPMLSAYPKVKPERKFSLAASMKVSEPLCGRKHIQDPSYVCFKDNEIYCTVCLSMHNFHCKEEVRAISDIPSEVREKLCRETEQELLCTQERLNKVKSENITNFNHLKEARKTYLKSVMKFKNYVMDVLDRLEKEAMLEMDILFSTHSRKLEENIVHIESQLSAIDKCLEKVCSSNISDNHAIIKDIQDATKTVRSYADDIIQSHKNTSSVEMKFEPSSELMKLLSSLEKLWKFDNVETVNCTSPYPCSCDKPFYYRTPVKCREFSAHSRWHFDREKCCITGCEFLPNGSVLLADNNNKKIKMFDRKYRYVSAQSLHSSPWDIAVVDAEKSVVTVPDRKRLQFISTHQKVSLKNHVTLGANCWGISHDNGNLYISCWSPEVTEILVTDLIGTPKRRIRTVNEMPLHTPWFIRARDDVIYISDWGTYMLSCVSSTGSSVQKYRSRNLVGPLGLAFDCDNNVYVCGRDSNNIHQLSPEGNFLQIVLNEKDGIQQPLSVQYNENDNRLLVTSWMSDKVQVFKFQ